jgi:putative Holliday junction resolvase
MQKMRVLAIDFGSKRIGLAISDPLRVIASPLENFDARHSLAETVEGLALHFALLKKERGFQIGEIVIGLPLNMNGTESDRSAIVRQFAKLLQEKLDLPVQLLDERLTTVMAERSLIEGGFSRKKRSKVVDSVSAVILLQTFLNQKGI